MKKIIFPLVVLALTCGVTRGQEEPAAVSEHLKCFGPMIGNWLYEGPLQEEIEDLADQGTQAVIRISWKRILDGTAVESNWSIKIGDGPELTGKALSGWDAKEEKIVQGGMDSFGAINLGSVMHDKAAKSLTLITKSVDGKGEESSRKIVMTKTDKDSFTWQAVERVGGLNEGPSPVYTFKRVKQQAKKQAE